MLAAHDKILLVGLGGQRCGSSWLGDYLLGHEDVFMSALKELHYFDSRLIPEMRVNLDRGVARRLRALALRTHDGDPAHSTASDRARLDAVKARASGMKCDADYLNFFLTRSGDKPVMAEVTPEYAFLDRAGFARIAKVHSKVRFAYLLRNPVDRFWSELRLYEKRGEPIPDAAGVLEYLRSPFSRRRNDYGRTLRELSAAVPADHIFVAFYERLFRDATMARLCAFLGIAFKPGDYAKRVHAVPQALLPETLREAIYRELADIYRAIADWFNGDIPQSWQNDMAAFG